MRKSPYLFLCKHHYDYPHDLLELGAKSNSKRPRRCHETGACRLPAAGAWARTTGGDTPVQVRT